MKLVASVCAVITLLAPATVCALTEGKPAPAIDMTLLDGGQFSLASARGQVVLIHFWASWCLPCRKEMTALDAYYRKHRGEGLKAILISLDDPFAEADVRKYMTPFSLPVAMAHDASFKGYGRIRHIPLSFLVDRKGILRKSGWHGETGIAEADFEKVVTPLLRQR